MIKRIYFWISLSRFLSSFSENIITFLLPILSYKTSGRITDSGWVVFLHVTFRLIGYPISGFLCDHFEEKSILVLTALLRSIFCILGSLLFINLAETESTLLLLFLNLFASIDGFAGGVTQIAIETIGPRFYPGKLFRSFQASIQSADQAALCLAPLSGAFLISRLGTPLFFLGIGAFFLAAAAFILPHPKRKILTQKPQNTSHSPSKPMRVLITDSLRPFMLILNSPIILATLILTILDNFLMGLYAAITTPMGLALFNVSEESLGLSLTLGYLASLAAISISHWIQPKKSTLWLWKSSYIIAYLGFFLLGFAPNFWIFVISVIFIEASCAVGVFALRLIRADAIPHSDFGKISGILFLLQQISLPFGGILVASITQPESLQNLMILSSILVGLVTIGVFAWTINIEKQLVT